MGVVETIARTSGSNRERGTRLILNGLFTFAAAVLAFLAFDDITTDWTAVSFRVEYACLAGCAVWCAVLGSKLVMNGYRVLGAISLLLLAGAVWGHRGIGLGTVPSWQLEYVLTVAAVIWFVALSIILVMLGVSVQRRVHL